jgi:NAD(P)-dependent dehydrogenase (short-subunit alcohol dehydrogenase family)
MKDLPLAIERTSLNTGSLAGKTAVVTGAGGGIGYETARAILWLGANVIIAEIDPQTGLQAEIKLTVEFEAQRVAFIETDVGNEESVARLTRESISRFGKVDIVINNATTVSLGNVIDLPIET